jgi:hypothetical protein
MYDSIYKISTHDNLGSIFAEKLQNNRDFLYGVFARANESKIIKYIYISIKMVLVAIVIASLSFKFK